MQEFDREFRNNMVELQEITEQKLPLSKDVKMRCLRQRAVLLTIAVTTERKEAVPNAQRKY